MSKAFQAIRGMNDVLPESIATWQYLESVCVDFAKRYAYREIRFPIVEQTALFKRSVGEVTDIVEKEMYTFDDRNGDSLSLRPEGTAGCVRAALQHGLLHNQLQRLWYMGPMYRHERPQKGRYRQFHQFSVEAFGMSGAAVEAEQISLTWRLFNALGLQDDVRLKLNSLGSSACREQYRSALVAYFKQYEKDLDEDCQRRLETNPLRILDSKNPEMKKLVAGAPVFQDYWSDESKQYFTELCELLTLLGVPYDVDTGIVRGLDYYCHTVYEWVTESLGAQGTVCAGGRYDGLVEQLGGKSTPAVGFSLGLERCCLMLDSKQAYSQGSDVYCVLLGDTASSKGLVVAQQLRDALPHLSIEVNADSASFKSQFKRADKSGAKYAVILGDDEVNANTVTLKNLRQGSEQQTLSFEEVCKVLEG